MSGQDTDPSSNHDDTVRSFNGDVTGTQNSPSEFEEQKSLHELARITSGLKREITRAEVSDSEEHHKHHKRGLLLERFKQLLRYCVYPEVVISHLNFDDLKIVLRSWLMMWSLTLLCICRGTENFMGPSSFLANFACGIEISGNLSVSSAFVYCITDEILLILAFLISVVTMAINWRLHGYMTEPQAVALMQQRGYCLNIVNPDFESCLVPYFHEGVFLSTKTTTVTVFGMLFSFTMCGVVQQRSKFARLAWLLNSLYTIIVFPFNNFCPLFKPWHYARNVVVPMSMAFAARFFVSLVVLPFSSSSRVLSNLSKASDALKALCDRMEDLLENSCPSRDNVSEQFGFIRGDAQTIFAKLVINELDMQMVNRIEFAFCRLRKTEISELRSQIRLVMSATSSFRFFFESINDARLNILCEDVEGMLPRHEDRSDKIKKFRYTPRVFVKRLSRSYKDTSGYEDFRRKTCMGNHDSSERKLTLDQLDAKYVQVTSLYSVLVRKSTSALACVSQWLSAVSKILLFDTAEFSRLSGELEAHVVDLSSQLEDLRFQGALEPDFALHAYNAVHFARRVRRLAQHCVAISSRQGKLRFITPAEASSAITGLIANNEDVVDGFHDNLGEQLDRTYTSFKPLSRVQARNPDSTPPRIFLHICGLYFERLIRAFYAPDLLFCVKRAILVTVTLIPYFCRPICARAYRHWFLWVAVLTSYTVARQAVDGLYGLLSRFVYNFWGCLVGMVAWYISAGSGRGNPFGYATVTAFVWLYICFQRQFNKHFNPSSTVVFSCTVTLVLGNSWNAGHVVLPGVELGRGFNVAWIRFVTVCIGISIAFLGTIFPYPFTAKRVVRTIIGTCLEHVGDLHALISNFAVQRYVNSDVHIVAQSDVITKSARAIMTDLDSAETLRTRLIYEPPLAGFYPTHRYKLLINYSLEVTQLMSLVYTFFDELEDTSNMPQVLSTMGWTDPKISGSVYSLLYMSSRAIADAKALPSVTSGYLATLYLCEILPRHLKAAEQHETPLYSLAIALTTQVYKRIDGIVSLIKELVGEVYDLNMNLYELEFENTP